MLPPDTLVAAGNYQKIQEMELNSLENGTLDVSSPSAYCCKCESKS